MNNAVAQMLARFERRSVDDHVNALREVFQQIALCGLWRAKFFEHAAFYGGTCLRILHGLDRFSEDMDFSLLEPDDDFDLARYCGFVEEELTAWGFRTVVEVKTKTSRSAVESAFLKANTREQLIVMELGDDVASAVHNRSSLKIKLEVDTRPPPGFTTTTRFVLQPIPFSVRAYELPALFAGKMHAVLCRNWKNRVKGRDWYDMVWYVANAVSLDLGHLEARMRQTGHYDGETQLDAAEFRQMLRRRIEQLDVTAAREDVRRFLNHPAAVDVWSREFFREIAERIEPAL